MTNTDLEKIRTKMKSTGLSARKIAEGAGLGQEWVQKFRAGVIVNPGVVTLGKLTRFLQDEELWNGRPPRP
jgi:transcriptional regulator with XRE-family HTH domain